MNRVIVFVPHQDDETNLAGNILSALAEKYDTYVVYSSLEMDKSKARIREKEAINACFVYGIAESHIIFLNYPDTPNREGYHYYTSGDKSIIKKIEKILVSLKPEIIIGTDFDFHSDHRMLSLALDEAVHNVMIENQKYMPLYLKGFCYETAYYGVEDYSASDLKDTVIKSKSLDNVSYRWEDRISIKSAESNGYIFNKIPYKALKCHKSQYATLHARSIINSDNVFWQKRTDNLLLRGSKIVASSGDASKLTDLKVIDTDDIITYDPRQIDYSKGLWIPDISDKKPHISIDFDKSENVQKIVFHGNPMMNYQYSCNIEIIIGNVIYRVRKLNPYGQPTSVILDIVCRHIDIFVHTKNALSEIEVFDHCDDGEVDILPAEKKKKNSVYIDFIDRVAFDIYVLLKKIIIKIINFVSMNK